MGRESKVLTWQYEDAAMQNGGVLIAGVDEVGRGCLAGPVVACAAIFLDRVACPPDVNDSKKLTRQKRQRLFSLLTENPNIVFSLGMASVEEIDKINILRATHLAMKRACEALNPQADYILVDGLRVKTLGDRQTPIVGGDRQSPSIAAASIIAKETRDILMEKLDLEYPGYGMREHKGYGTKQHLEAIHNKGITPIHRRSFDPVRQRVFDF